MLQIKFNSYHKKLILQMKKEGFVTRRSQKVYGWDIGFSMSIRWLKERHLVMEDGVVENNMKKWKLSEKGNKLADMLQEINQMVCESG